MLEEEDLLKSIEDDCWNDLLDDFNKFTDYIKKFREKYARRFSSLCCNRRCDFYS